MTNEEQYYLDVYAYLGEDEMGSGEIGLKQAMTPVGMIPLVAIDRGKLDRDSIKDQLQQQATEYGKTIRLVRLVYAETVLVIEP